MEDQNVEAYLVQVILRGSTLPIDYSSDYHWRNTRRSASSCGVWCSHASQVSPIILALSPSDSSSVSLKPQLHQDSLSSLHR